MTIVVVTGSRTARRAHRLKIMQGIIWGTRGDPVDEVWEGAAAGVDHEAHQAALELKWGYNRFPAQWELCVPDWYDPIKGTYPCQSAHRQWRSDRGEYCPVAGFRRNQEMIDALLHAEGRKLCVAYPVKTVGSHGTADCLTRAWRSGIATVVLPLDPA